LQANNQLRVNEYSLSHHHLSMDKFIKYLENMISLTFSAVNTLQKEKLLHILQEYFLF